MHQPDIIEFRSIRNVPEIVNATFDFIRQNFRLFWRSLLFLAFPPIALGTFIFSYFYIATLESTFRNSGSEFSDMLTGLLYISLLGGLLGATGLTILIAVIHAFVLLYRERGPNAFTVQDVWEEVKKFFWNLFFTVIGLGMIGSLLMMMSIFLPFGIFGLVVVVAFGSLYFPLRIYEGRGFFQAFIVSSKLIEKRWWATYGMICLFGLSNIALVGILTIPIALAAWIGESSGVDWNQLGDSTSIIRILGTVLIGVWNTVSFLLYGIPFLSLIFHYFSQKERRQSIGLLQAVESIGTGEEVV